MLEGLVKHLGVLITFMRRTVRLQFTYRYCSRLYAYCRQQKQVSIDWSSTILYVQLLRTYRYRVILHYVIER